MLAVTIAMAGCARAPLALPQAADQGQVAGEPAQEESGGDHGDKQPYEDVITDEAETQRGLFIVHRVGDRTYFEIPADALGKDMLWHVETAAVPPGLPIGRPLGKRMVRWERAGDVIEVRDYTVAVGVRASDAPYAEPGREGNTLGVSQVTLPAIMRAFPVVADGPEGSAVIDVTAALAADFPEFSAIGELEWADLAGMNPQIDEARSRVKEVKAFERNVEVRNELTFMTNALAPDGTAMGAVTLELRHSLLRLPDEPMRPRYADPRVGYFGEFFQDYSYREDDTTPFRQLITRYRLEKQDPEAELSAPVQPIVFYISRTIPEQWRPYVQKGIEAWQPAFEAAGFKDAIVGRLAPSAEEDPTWDAFDARHSVIRWEYSEQPYGGLGLTISDPRSGEILSSRVFITADMLGHESFAYFTQASALDERARELPLPDDLAGRLIQAVVEHEIGHALGLAHNFKASQAYTIEQLRDPAFVAENGITASIMSYSAYNYVAQPEDGVTELIPRPGPYDTFAINWGYRPIPEAETPADEAATLDAWAAEQLKNPWLAYDGDYEGDDDTNDPTVQWFNVGADRVESARLGIKNLERSLEYLVPSMTRLGQDYGRLARAYEDLVGMRVRMLGAVTSVAGGVIEKRALGGRADVEYTPVPVEEQRAAVAFMLEQLEVPQAFLRTDVTYRLQPTDVMEPLQSSQLFLLSLLLDASKYRALSDLETTYPDRDYPLGEYLADIRRGVWRELESPDGAIHPMRRALQRHYLEVLGAQLAAFDAVEDPMAETFLFDPNALVRGTDFRAAARADLRDLRAQIEAALPDADAPMTRAHLEDARDKIEEILSVKGG